MAYFEETCTADISLAKLILSLYGFFPDIKEEDIRFFYLIEEKWILNSKNV